MSFRDISHVMEEWKQGSAYEKMTEPERRRHDEMGRIIESFVNEKLTKKTN